MKTVGFTNVDDDDDDSDGDDLMENVPAWDIPKSPYDAVFRKRVGGLGGAPLKASGLEELNKSPDTGNSHFIMYALLISLILTLYGF